MQTGIESFSKGELILLKLLWASITQGEKNKGADWQMTSYHKIKLEFNPLYLKHIIFESCTSMST